MKKLKISQEKFNGPNSQNKQAFLAKAGPEWKTPVTGQALELTLKGEMSAQLGEAASLAKFPKQTSLTLKENLLASPG